MFNAEFCTQEYCQTSNIRRALVVNKLVYHSDVVGALSVDWSIYMSPGLNV